MSILAKRPIRAGVMYNPKPSIDKKIDPEWFDECNYACPDDSRSRGLKVGPPLVTRVINPVPQLSIQTLRGDPEVKMPRKLKIKDNRIRRPAYQSFAPLPRTVQDLDSARQLLEEDQGIQVRLGDKTLNALTQQRVPLVHPDGSPQVDGQGNQLYADTRDSLMNVIKDLKATTISNKEDMIAKIGDVYAILNSFTQLTSVQLEDVKAVISKLPIPKTFASLNLPRFVGGKVYSEYKEEILGYLLANASTTGGGINYTSPSKMVFGKQVGKGKLRPQPVGNAYFDTAMTRPEGETILDLVDRRLMNLVDCQEYIRDNNIPVSQYNLEPINSAGVQTPLDNQEEVKKKLFDSPMGTIPEPGASSIGIASAIARSGAASGITMTSTSTGNYSGMPQTTTPATVMTNIPIMNPSSATSSVGSTSTSIVPQKDPSFQNL